MRPIHVVTLDKARPAAILTREAVRPFRTRVTVAPITSTTRGLSTEVRVDDTNGLDHQSVISLDNIATVPWPISDASSGISLQNRSATWRKRSLRLSIWTSSTHAAMGSPPARVPGLAVTGPPRLNFDAPGELGYPLRGGFA